MDRFEKMTNIQLLLHDNRPGVEQILCCGGLERWP